MPVGLRSRVPAKMTSCMLTPRSNRADCSPSTQEMASEMFDLPQPLGPTMAAMPSPWKRRSVRSQNDLKPRICSFLSLSNVYSLRGEAEPPRQRWRRRIKATLTRRNGKSGPDINPTLLLCPTSGQDANHTILGYPVEYQLSCAPSCGMMGNRGREEPARRQGEVQPEQCSI